MFDHREMGESRAGSKDNEDKANGVRRRPEI